MSDREQSPSAEDAVLAAERLELEAVCQDDEAAQSRLLAEARSILNRALAAEPNSARLHHWLGLCWYQDPPWNEAARQAMEYHFKSAIELAPGYEFPSLYLGHFYFDEGRYAEALPLFQKMDEQYFEEISQRWRILKNRELILCCRLYLHPAEVAVSELEAVCLAYEEADQVEAPVPQEIVACVATLIEVEPEKMEAMAKRVIELVRRLECEDAFWIRSNYQRLQQVFP
jgi:tetratricopeptide (TPR) repeat protein